MNPLPHAKNSARRYGGKPEDYMDIHVWLDQTKTHVGDLRHRVVLHNSFGVGLCEQMFGLTRTNSEGKLYSVRAIAEDHIKEDLGFIPSLDQSLSNVPITEMVAPKLRYIIHGEE